MKDKILLTLFTALLIAVGVEGYYIYRVNKQLTNQNSYYKPTVSIQKPTNSTINTPSQQKLSNHTPTFSQIAPSLNINPFKEFQKMQEEMNRVFGSFNAQFQNDPDFDRFFQNFSVSPAMDLKDAGDKYIVTVEIPGSKKNSIKVDVKNHILKVSAKTETIKDKKSSKFIQKERYIGSFEREITLPSDADESSLKTKYDNGILTITIAKKK